MELADFGENPGFPSADIGDKGIGGGDDLESHNSDRLLRAAFFLDLAKHARRSTRGSLARYRLYHSPPYRYFFICVACGQMALPLVLPVAYGDPTRLHGAGWRKWLALEAFIVVLFGADLVLERRVMFAIMRGQLQCCQVDRPN